MKAIPEPPLDVEPMYESIKGAQIFILLQTALDLRLFDFFRKPETAGRFAGEAGLDPDLTVKFLNALVATGFLKQVGSQYANSESAAIYLTEDSPFYQGNLIKLMDRTLSERWAKLGTSLKDGPKQAERPTEHVFNKSFILAMAEGAMRGGLHETLKCVTALPEFQSWRRLLDLGGGHGLYAIGFAQANPKLECTVFDFPAVLEVTREYLERYEMQDRVSLLGGDYVHDDFGGGYDVVFASDCLYKPEEELRIFLEKLKQSLNGDGMFISKHWLMDETRAAPETTVLWDLMISITAGPSMYTFSDREYQAILSDAGFKVEVVDISTPSKPSAIFVCRKGAR